MPKVKSESHDSNMDVRGQKVIFCLIERVVAQSTLGTVPRETKERITLYVYHFFERERVKEKRGEGLRSVSTIRKIYGSVIGPLDLM